MTPGFMFGTGSRILTGIPGIIILQSGPRSTGVTGIPGYTTVSYTHLQRWNQDGANMKAELEAAGYEVDLQYASNDVQTQVSQIENLSLIHI